MIAVVCRWVAGSLRGSIDVNTAKNDFHYSFILKFSTEESSLPVGRQWVASGSPVGRQWVASGSPVGHR